MHELLVPLPRLLPAPPPLLLLCRLRCRLLLLLLLVLLLVVFLLVCLLDTCPCATTCRWR
jgi:hypothetical protein